MAIDKNTGEVITLKEATGFTNSFQTAYPEAVKAFFAGTNPINSILEQEGCIGIRFYNGYDTEQQQTNLVLVGVDKNGKDITNGVIVERLTPCPPDCPTNSSLIKP